MTNLVALAGVVGVCCLVLGLLGACGEFLARRARFHSAPWPAEPPAVAPVEPIGAWVRCARCGRLRRPRELTYSEPAHTSEMSAAWPVCADGCLPRRTAQVVTFAHAPDHPPRPRRSHA